MSNTKRFHPAIFAILTFLTVAFIYALAIVLQGGNLTTWWQLEIVAPLRRPHTFTEGDILYWTLMYGFLFFKKGN
jgi:hypothetical protein